jgi:hypothetical protein
MAKPDKTRLRLRKRRQEPEHRYSSDCGLSRGSSRKISRIVVGKQLSSGSTQAIIFISILNTILPRRSQLE